MSITNDDQAQMDWARLFLPIYHSIWRQGASHVHTFLFGLFAAYMDRFLSVGPTFTSMTSITNVVSAVTVQDSDNNVPVASKKQMSKTSHHTPVTKVSAGGGKGSRHKRSGEDNEHHAVPLKKSRVV
ncbi:hypothetical protein EDD18DRAFT_1356174 [Armillaria luteobubalina]|uniref:Uncharacterized protein n=1 Tax=Armillaria luteobubalina TaxID=153913 RepID=A0AA39UL16_9AGAR|nr:hypothetical protein EDD18DRAFT_1356174 [Armillaria luteobubalina]